AAAEPAAQEPEHDTGAEAPWDVDGASNRPPAPVTEPLSLQDLEEVMPKRERREREAAPKEPAAATPPADAAAPSERATAAPEDQTEAEHSIENAGPGVLGWVLLVLVFGVLGFIGWRLYEASSAPDPVPEPEAETSGDPSSRADEEDEPAQGSEAPSPDERRALAHELAYGRTVGDIPADLAVSPAEGEGVLVVEAPEGAAPTRVRAGERDLGRAPLETALPAGRHELVFERGAEQLYRYLYLRAGTAKYVQLP
ncbi:MAG: hypothetical protein ACOCUS_04340, partial [Polyangiales bacterium]